MSTAAPTRSEQVNWALQTLDIPLGTTTRAVRSAIIAQLEDCEFVPPPIVAEAIQMLAPYATGSSAAANRDTPPPVPVAAMGFSRHVERRLHEQVDEFAEQFFSLAVPVRHATWTRLVDQAQAYPTVLLRLQTLRRGLGLICPPIPDNEHRLLAEACMRLFVMRPAMRAVSRSALLRRREDKSWVKSARQFARQYPPLAALAPEVFEGLKKWQRTPKTFSPPPVVVVHATRSPQVRKLMGWLIAMLLTGLIGLWFVGPTGRPRNNSSPSWAPPTQSSNPELQKQIEEIRARFRDLPPKRSFEMPDVKQPDIPSPTDPAPSEAPPPLPIRSPSLDSSLDPRVRDPGTVTPSFPSSVRPPGGKPPNSPPFGRANQPPTQLPRPNMHPSQGNQPSVISDGLGRPGQP